MEFVLILVAGAFFALVHIFNGWLFQWVEISNHISWVYLPAFLRLFYVLVLGRVNGFIAIFAGGLMLATQFSEPGIVMLANNVCAGLAPVLASIAVQRWNQRAIGLDSIRDLLQFSVVYCALNALLHHVVWFIVDPSQWREPLQIAGMVMGDFFGCVIGVGLMKAAIDRFGLPTWRSNTKHLD